MLLTLEGSCATQIKQHKNKTNEIKQTNKQQYTEIGLKKILKIVEVEFEPNTNKQTHTK